MDDQYGYGEDIDEQGGTGLAIDEYDGDDFDYDDYNSPRNDEEQPENPDYDDPDDDPTGAAAYDPLKDDDDDDEDDEEKQMFDEANRELAEMGGGEIVDPTKAAVLTQIRNIISQLREDPHKNEPVTLKWLVDYWNTAWFNVLTMKLCRRIDKIVKAQLTALTSGWHWAITLVKFKYPFNTIGSLLELLEGPVGSIGLGIDVRQIINAVLKFPIIQQLLKLLRRILYPILNALALLNRKDLGQKIIDELLGKLQQKYLKPA